MTESRLAQKVRAKGAFDGTSCLICAPTNTGKSYIAQQLIVQYLENQELGYTSVYLCPYKALAEEIAGSLEDMIKARVRQVEDAGGFSSLRDRMPVVSTGDYAEPIDFSTVPLLVATYEKFAALLARRKDFRPYVVIADEAQLISDETRGPRAEFLIASLVEGQGLGQSVLFYPLSAVAGNAKKIAEWLGLPLVQGDDGDRFVPLTIRPPCVHDGAAATEFIQRTVIKEVGEGRQVLILDPSARANSERRADGFQREVQEVIAEERRLLYVACTRARERVIFSLPQPSDEQGRPPQVPPWSDWLENILGPAIVDGVTKATVPNGSARFRIVRNVTPADKQTALVDHLNEYAEQPVELLRPPGLPRIIPAISAGAVAEYRYCPYRYYVARQLGIPGAPTLRTVGETGSDAEKGTLAHLALQLCDLASGEIPEPVLARAGGDRDWLISLVQGFLASTVGGEVRGLPPDKILREARFRLPLPDTGGTTLVGVIDMAYQRDDGWAVVEYKTGQPRKETRKLHIDQTHVYATGLRRERGLTVGSAVVAYLNEPESAWTRFTPTPLGSSARSDRGHCQRLLPRRVRRTARPRPLRGVPIRRARWYMPRTLPATEKGRVRAHEMARVTKSNSKPKKRVTRYTYEDVLYKEQDLQTAVQGEFKYVLLATGDTRHLTAEEIANPRSIPAGATPFRTNTAVSPGVRANTTGAFTFQGKPYHSGDDRNWKTTMDGMVRLAEKGRLDLEASPTRMYRQLLDDSPYMPHTNYWDDVRSEQNRLYAVQTAAKVVGRGLLMTTDPGDLVFDPTCGSGTTAHLAEQFGRRWS